MNDEQDLFTTKAPSSTRFCRAKEGASWRWKSWIGRLCTNKPEHQLIHGLTAARMGVKG